MIELIILLLICGIALVSGTIYLVLCGWWEQ